MEKENTLLMEDARLIFRNFSGKEGKYNREGDRNFCVLLEDELAMQLLEDGWNVKFLRGREPGDDEQPYLQVSVGYKNRPPKIQLVTSKGRTPLDESECEVIDWIDIAKVDLIVRPYKWDVSGKTGIKAYLKTMFVVVDEDFLEQKYADVAELEQLPARAGRTYDYIDAEVVEDRKEIER